MNIQEIKNESLSEVYYKIDHDSGLTIYVMPKENYKSAYAIFGTNYGSVDTAFSENGNEPVRVPEGIAHFLEHKLFESEELDAFSRYAETGADANAFTTFDKTCYLFSCSNNFRDSLEILLDFVKSPYFTRETVEKEQGIIGQEIRMYQDKPDWQVLFNLLRGMYHNNPVRIDIAGTVDSIAEINADLLYKCYDTFYNNSNMVLAAVGNVSVEQVLQVADKCLKKEEKIEIQRISDSEPDSIKQAYVEQDMHVGIKRFILGFKENECQKVDIKRSVLMTIVYELICGSSTEFFAELLEKELVNADFYAEHFHGRGFDANFFGGESNDPEAVKQALLQRIRFLKENGLDEKRFEEIRRAKYGNEVKSFNNIETLANALVSAHFDSYGIFDIIEIYKNITVKDAQEVLNECFDENKCVLSVIK